MRWCAAGWRYRAAVPVDTPLFTSHPRRWQDNRYVYPVISRRSRGLSLGVNLNPDGACNFDCAYCSVDRRVPPTVRTVDLDVLRTELDQMLQWATSGELFAQPPFDTTPESLRRLNDVAFSGDGEPTSYARLGEACELVSDLLAWHGLPTKVVVITNATLLHQERVAQALDRLGERGEVWAKLDAGSEPWYRLVDRSDVPFSRILANLELAGRRRPLVIQSLFCRLHGTGPDAAEITAYVGRLTALRAAGAQLARIQVYTTARSTAESWVKPLERSEVDAIVAAVVAAGFTADPFYGPA
jgi:wyosine [tRNA(Phe)-imidazoG37] synthetase (radical SAM superfamily)